MSTAFAKSPFIRNLILFLAFIILLLLALSFFMPAWRVWTGIAARLVLAALTFVYSADFYFVRKSKLGGIILLAVGLILLVTAILGYGFNDHPPVPWLIAFRPTGE